MTEPSSPPDADGSGLVEGFHRLEQWIHRRALRLFNLEAHERDTQVHLMLANRQRGVVEYWTFLVLSMSIATLGLAMDSTTVVIGAMLVSPLMGPIVEFAMGLVVGSPVLTLRSTLRIFGSVVVVVTGAWLITVVLPFQEVTGEIAARTHPTLLDMALAVCVAVAAALTTVKARSETNIVAAGAAIGIALVPPICVVGFGLGIGDPEVYGGALLLLVTNFFAIIAVGVFCFYLLGYERVSVRAWDDEALAAARPASLTRRVLLAVERIFGSRRTGHLFRFALPLVLIAAVWGPLASGLRQITWEARTRAAVNEIMAEVEAEYDEFDTEWDVAAGRVRVSTYLVGAIETADSLRARLVTRIAAVSAVEPDVQVHAMPSYQALQRVVEPRGGEGARAASPPEVEFARLRQEVAAGLGASWPGEVYGPLLGWHLQLSDGGAVDLHLQHLGPAPDAGAARLLAAALGPRVPPGLEVRFDAVDTLGVRVAAARAAEWLPALARSVEVVRETRRLRVCVEIPGSEARGRSTTVRSVAETAENLLLRLPPQRYGLRVAGDSFAVRLEPEGSGRQEAAEVPVGGDVADVEVADGVPSTEAGCGDTPAPPPPETAATGGD